MKFAPSRLTGFFTATLAVTAMLTSTVGCTADSGGGGTAGTAANNNKKEGTVDGGGGKGVLCKLPNGSQSLRTLDTYESELRGETPDTIGSGLSVIDTFVEYGTLKIGPMLMSPTSTIEPEPERRQSLRNFFATEFEARLNRQTKPLGHTADATLPPIPSECQIVQIAIWQNSGVIDLDTNLWNLLSTREKAVLAMHEVLYFYSRKDGATTSDESRWIIGSAFSSKPLSRRFPEAMTNRTSPIAWCHGGGGDAPYDGPTFEVYAQEEVQNSTSGVGLYLQYTRSKNEFGFGAYTETRTFVPNLTLDQLVSGQWPSNIRFSNRFRKNEWIFQQPSSTTSYLTTEIIEPSGRSGLSTVRCALD